jgi:multisubunit Na+/H+ antiporter MnhB subunit
LSTKPDVSTYVMDLQSEPERDPGIEVQASKPTTPVLDGVPTGSPPQGSGRTFHWRSLSDAVLFTLVIAGPTMLWEEVWRGRPMIDQEGNLWMLPAVIVIAAYFFGGAIAGRHRRRPGGALIQAGALAISTSLMLIIADIGRRLVLGQNLRLAVAGLWLAAVGATIVIAALGALFGRWVYRWRRTRLSVTRRG